MKIQALLYVASRNKKLRMEASRHSSLLAVNIGHTSFFCQFPNRVDSLLGFPWAKLTQMYQFNSPDLSMSTSVRTTWENFTPGLTGSQ